MRRGRCLPFWYAPQINEPLLGRALLSSLVEGWRKIFSESENRSASALAISRGHGLFCEHIVVFQKCSPGPLFVGENKSIAIDFFRRSRIERGNGRMSFGPILLSTTRTHSLPLSFPLFCRLVLDNLRKSQSKSKRRPFVRQEGRDDRGGMFFFVQRYPFVGAPLPAGTRVGGTGLETGLLCARNSF